ncbi:YdhK family protein [Fundicoccus culcitae]|uniref:YdhK family protein n=1 Tax=Fundicoccus culcitae TaxID=2969821 RepID=A0ABY5P2D5_9LACT|nr:YdhK family protein [Fundicoccus culcitae]UUX32761.1 YdhK family protein [Fundicoccus culcitae]
MKKFIGKGTLVLSTALLLGVAVPTIHTAIAQDSESVESVEMDHAMMEHDDEGRLPANIMIEREPTFKVGDSVVVSADHMDGMNGAEGVVVAAFDTVAYEVTYTPTDGSQIVENHRWVVHEEIAGTNSRDEAEVPFEVGAEVSLEAYHMPGMEGAMATIEAVNDVTVYMIDYVDTQSGELVINHKWVTEDELSALAEETDPAASDEEEVTESQATEDSQDAETESDAEETTDESNTETTETEADSTESEAESDAASDDTEE